MAKATDKKRWDDLRTKLAEAHEATSAYERELGSKYGYNFNRSWLSKGQRDKLERLHDKEEKIGDKIMEMVLRLSPRGDAWMSGVPAWWVRRDLTWEDMIRPAGEPLSVTVPGAYGYPDGYVKEKRIMSTEEESDDFDFGVRVEEAPRRGSSAPDKRAIDFFYKYAGYSYGPGETPEQGRKRGAVKLAHAEREATARGWRVQWEDDPEGWDSLGDIDPDDVKEVLSAVLYDENDNVLGSLGSIADPDRNYARVVEAELALEALPREGGEALEEAPRRQVPPATVPYQRSSTGQYSLRRDGREVMHGTEDEIWKWLHRNHGYSVDHALRYEGYKIVPVGAFEAPLAEKELMEAPLAAGRTAIPGESAGHFDTRHFKAGDRVESIEDGKGTVDDLDRSGRVLVRWDNGDRTWVGPTKLRHIGKTNRRRRN